MNFTIFLGCFFILLKFLGVISWAGFFLLFICSLIFEIVFLSFVFVLIMKIFNKLLED